MTPKFNACMPFVFEQEGFKSNSANDAGGLTIWGLCQKYEPEAIAVMKDMTPEQAQEYAKPIYYRNYWTPINAENYPIGIALALFDSAVNCGVNITKEWISEIVGSNPNMPIPLTIHDLLFKRQRRYLSIVINNETQKEFLQDWINRTVDLWEYRFKLNAV